MFARANRLNRSQDILKVLRRGGKRSSGPITCYFVGMGGGHTAATVIVDKKVSKLAIVRNLIKRRIRAILRQQGLPEGHLVVRAYQGAASLSHEQISKHLQVCLRAPSR